MITGCAVTRARTCTSGSSRCPKRRCPTKLCFRCDALPCLDDNLLKHWLDICLGDNQLQYLFMGQASTYSKLHVDPGGLDLLIAPLSPSRWRPACLESVNKG